MMKKYYTLILSFTLSFSLLAQQNDLPDPVKGFCIAAPQSDGVDDFVTFIDQELAPRGINTLVLRVDFNYQFKSRPELQEENALSEADVKKLVAIANQHDVNIIPQINLLGHQSWAGDIEKLLEVYPEFDETPHVEMPEEYEWPNEDGLYCKSYCPLHPEVHSVVFDLVDEIMDVFEAKAFHAGMDEVFYIGDDKCPRCAGRDKAELFAGEVTKIRNHLAENGRELWIWGDRLIDGKTTGLGMWEASMNNTHRAVDMIPKDVVICDWHYNRVEPTAAYFTMKGLRVITCPWNKAEVAVEQWKEFEEFRAQANPELAKRYLGMMQTIWTGNSNFLNAYKNEAEADAEPDGTVQSFKALFENKQK
ncbi:family 20 glycosylhydrolase [Catalinimonas niigatensis]|uniref:family 20 glycosylhydrolase n=1 Tax=Catalinimonas niigatensis TaxID=1397264 RepID=UPI0026666789|nr:family 20 glycosylhydrolase [Catalinimonas niigatensis]WPP50439.1 family 20 glycosylhydrolase [Catalinimonas niigatensis]